MTDGQGLRVLTGSDIDQILARLDLNKAISSQAAVFSAFSSSASGSAGSSSAPGDDVSPSIQNPHRTTIDSLHATSLFMPARVAELGVMTCKIVSVPKSQSEGGLPAVTAVLDDRGRVKGLVNARRLTAMRNACGSALFLQHCPTRTPPTSLAIFGSGEQAYAHASVLLGVYTSIKTLTFVVRKATERVQRLIERLQSEHPLISVQSVVSFDLDFSDPSSSDSESLRQAVSQAQIIITATSSTTPLFPCSYVSPGTRLILIGSYKPHMHEVDTDLVRRSGTLVVDSVKACMKEAGEIISAGLGPVNMRELGTLEGEGADVGGNDDVVLFKSVGLGVQDVAIAKLVLDEAEGMGIGIIIPNFD